MKKQGWAIHCHHGVLVEWCYDYDKRAKAIKKDKPKHEQETRLRLFKILPNEAVNEIPIEMQKANRKWWEARKKEQKAYKKEQKVYKKQQVEYQKLLEVYQKLREAYQKWQNVCQEEREAYQEREEAYQERLSAYQEELEAYQEWPQKDKDKFHQRWCGCLEWNGQKIVFRTQTEEVQK